MKNALIEFLSHEISRSDSPAARAIAKQLRGRYGPAVLGILFYGSCLRKGTAEGGILDLYVLVDRYRKVHSSLTMAVLNSLLPPNVLYTEQTTGDRTLRAKYAIVSLDDFVRHTSKRCFHAAFWARFAQPCALIYARDHVVEERILGALGSAVETFISRTIPLMPPVFSATDLWKKGLAESYRTELRPESSAATAALVEADSARYQQVTRAAAEGLTICEPLDGDGKDLRFRGHVSNGGRWSSRQAWRIRRIQGKILNFLRLAKAAFTFEGGVDYLLWKIERHSGVREEATPLARRHPLLAFWTTAWRLYRRGAFR
jgi:hypothetical protein